MKVNLCRKVKESGSKTAAYETTDKGKKLTDKYAELRREILTEQTKNIDQVDEKLQEATKVISLLTGMYDEAGRKSASYSSIDLDN